MPNTDPYSSSSKLMLMPSLKPEPEPIVPDGTTSYLEPEFTEHYTNWKRAPDPTTAGALVRRLDPVLNEAIRMYGSSAQGSPTLKSKTKRLALNAIKTYDPTRAKLRTHMLSQLQSIRRLAAREEQIFNIPEQVMLDLSHMRKMENQMKDELGRDPSDMEMADFSGISPKRLAYIRKLKPTYAEGNLTSVNEEGTSLNIPAVTSVIPSKAMQSWQDFIYHDLQPVDQVIMEHTLGMNNKAKLSNQDIASKLKLTPGAVSQRKAKIQEKLDQYESTGLG